MKRLILLVLLASGTAEARQPATRGALTAEEKVQIEIFRAASQSVVNITSLALRGDIFSMDQTEVPQGTGSGFIWDDTGHIVTNFHVIEHASDLLVTLSDHSQHRASIVGYDADNDVAVIKIEPKGNLRPIAVGTSADLAVGQVVYAIGNPFGLDQSLTVGIISALGREIRSVSGHPIEGVIQTDAVINPGNSGGPLLDSSGRMIGMNTAIYSPTGSSVGIGFAVPIDTVNAIAEQLVHYGRSVHPTIGVRIAADNLAKGLGVKGVLVVEVVPGSGADVAGLRPTTRNEFGGIALGDVIVEADGKPVRASADLYRALDAHPANERVTLGLRRNGKTVRVQVPLSLR